MASMTVRAPSARLAAARPRAVARRAVVVQAKYGEQSKYFDLKDMENTTGSWQMYGNDSKERYPQLQAEFFNRAAESLSRRVALRGIIAASGLAALTQWGYAGAKAVKLPITVGPLTGGENGKGGSVSSKL